VGAAAIGNTRLAADLDTLLAIGAAHGTDALVAALRPAVAFRRFRATDVRSILAAGTGTPPTTARRRRRGAGPADRPDPLPGCLQDHCHHRRERVMTTATTARPVAPKSVAPRTVGRLPVARPGGTRFRGQFAYVDAALPDQTVMPLMRLRYGGSASVWGFAIYLASSGKYEDSILPSGAPAGSPEEALDCACGLYLNDPTAWQQPPTN